MAEFSFPFDTGAGASITQDNWSEMARWWSRSGVPSSGGLTVTTSGTIRATTVTAGYASILGHYYKNDANIVVTHAENTSGQPRLDLVVLRLDMDLDKVWVPTTAVAGTPAANPLAPVPAGDYDSMTSRIWEIPLAVVRVEPSTLTIGADKINDDFRWRAGMEMTTGIKDVRPNHFRFRPAGHVHFDQDTEQWVGRISGRWAVMAQTGAYKSWTPVVTYGGAAPQNTLTTKGIYRWIGDRTVDFRVTITGPSGGTWFNPADPGFLEVSLPFPAASDAGDQLFNLLYTITGENPRLGLARAFQGSTKATRIYLQGTGNTMDFTSEAFPLNNVVMIIQGTLYTAEVPA